MQPTTQAPLRLDDGSISAGGNLHAGASLHAGGTLYSVQLLRFVAAAFVVLSHIRAEFKLEPFGIFGVDIFFVISGFIIYHVTRGDVTHFFTRRLIRIVPLYWLGTLALTAVAVLAPSLLNNVQFTSAMRVVASLFFIPYWTEANDFEPTLSFGWTLNYELLFYFVFFIAMRISHRHRFLAASAMLLAIALSAPIAAPHSAHFFWSQAIIVEFFYGMAIAVVVERTRFLSLARMPLWAGAAAMALFCYLLYPGTGYVRADHMRFVAIGIPSMALVFIVLGCEGSFRKLPKAATRIIGFLGDLSFATYIFHAYVMALLKRLIGQDMSIYLYGAAVLASTLLVASAIFLIVEKPSRIFLTNRLVGRKVLPPDVRPVPAT